MLKSFPILCFANGLRKNHVPSQVMILGAINPPTYNFAITYLQLYPNYVDHIATEPYKAPRAV